MDAPESTPKRSHLDKQKARALREAGERQRRIRDRRTKRLFIAYRKRGNLMARDLIYQEHLYLADVYAKKYAGRGAEYEDLRQEASMGLLKAVEGFDPDRDVGFTTYAIWFVEGWIRQYFRDKAWVCKVPRRVKGMSLQIKNLSRELGRFPTREEIAERCDIPEERMGDAIAAAQTWCSVSINQDQADTGTSSSAAREIACEDNEIEAMLTRLSIEEAARRALDDEESKIVRMYYIDELSQREIAARLGTYQMAVSRSLQRSTSKLEAALKKGEEQSS